MQMILLGIATGAIVGFGTNYLLIRAVEQDLAAGKEPIAGIGTLFFVRYLVDAFALLLYWWVIDHDNSLIAMTFSLTISVKISLLRYYLRKGGRIE